MNYICGECIHIGACLVPNERGYVEQCEHFKEKPKHTQEQTNEEWFTSLSTEEKADKLTDFSFWLVPALPSEERRERIRKKLMEWLKEKHNA